MRIALLHYAMVPVIGGVESIIAAHKGLFEAGGHEVITIARRGNADRILEAADPLPELRTAVSGCDLVIVHNVLTMPFDLPLTEAVWELAREKTGGRWICWIHDIAALNPDYDHPWHLPPWDLLAKVSPEFSYVAVSEHRAGQFCALTGLTPRVVPNGISPEETLGLSTRMRELCARYAVFQREIVLIHPTRLLRRKNVEFGLEVLAALRAKGRDAITLITAAGDPHNSRSAAYADELRARREQLNLQDAAIFVADDFHVEQQDLTSLYAVGDALLFPSRQEGFGLPVVEAALQRLVVFVADVPPLNSLLAHGVHVFDPEGSPDEVAALIERTLDRAPACRSRREVLSQYAWSAIRERHLWPLLEGR